MSTSIQEQDLIQKIKQLEQRISDLERQQRNFGSNIENTAFIDGLGYIVLSLPDGMSSPYPTGESGIEITPTGIRLFGRKPGDPSITVDIDLQWNSWNNIILTNSNVSVREIFQEFHWFVPATSTSTGTAGEIKWDSSHIYVCTATNTWRRVALSTW
jgi:hypothetical protein